MSKTSATDSTPLTKEQLDDLQALDREPDLIDIPPAAAENWRFARQLSKPRKEAISLRLDADVLDWLKHRTEGYQTEINRILREKMQAEMVG